LIKLMAPCVWHTHKFDNKWHENDKDT
jgi:hypothetical protein